MAPIMDLDRAARKLRPAFEGGDARTQTDAMRAFVEEVSFAPADEILEVLRTIAAEDWMAMPPWGQEPGLPAGGAPAPKTPRPYLSRSTSPRRPPLPRA